MVVAFQVHFYSSLFSFVRGVLSDPGPRAWSLDARLETSAKFGAFGEWTAKSTTPLKATRDTRLSLATKLVA